MISPGSLLPALKLNSFAQRWLASIIFWATDLKRFPGGARADIRIHSLLITMISPALLSGCLFVTIDSPLLEANEVVCSSNLQRALPPPHPLCRSYLQTGSDHSFPLPSQKKKKKKPSRRPRRARFSNLFSLFSLQRNVLFSFLGAHTHAGVAH